MFVVCYTMDGNNQWVYAHDVNERNKIIVDLLSNGVDISTIAAFNIADTTV